MTVLFDKALAFTLKHEGGYVNDKDDKGGETYRGISRVHHPEWEGWEYVDRKDWVTADSFVNDFYRKKYWDGLCNNLPAPLCFVVFDSAVLCGRKRAQQWLLECNGDHDKYLFLREAFHRNSKQTKFIKGWVNRVEALRQYVWK